MYAAQECFCVSHYEDLVKNAEKHLPRRAVGEFLRATAHCTQNYLAAMQGELSGFTKSFDYRYRQEPFEKLAVEHVIQSLCGFYEDGDEDAR